MCFFFNFYKHVCVSFWQQELVKEASTKIRRYYGNNYKYGAAAKTICKFPVYS